MIRTAAARLWAQRRELAAFSILFRLLEGLLFTPLLAVAGHALAGRTVVDSTAILAFLLSARGVIALVLGLTVLLTLRLVEQTGLAFIVMNAMEGRPVRGHTALAVVAAELPRLARLAAGGVGRGLLIALPLLATAAGFAARLLGRHDINYYLATRPSEFMVAAGLTGAVALATAAVAAWLVVRWRLVVPVSLFDRAGGAAAFRASAALVRGGWWPLAGLSLASGLLVLGLGLASAWLSGVAATFGLGVMSGAALSLAIVVGFMVALRTIISALATLAGACVDAAVVTLFYRERRGARAGVPSAAAAPPGLAAWVLPAGGVLVLLITAGLQTVLAVGALHQDRTIAVTAHRGSHKKAPENTVAAIREAIDTGAQFAEIDVQVSKDGVLVVTHDSDFSRLGGVAVKVWDLGYQEIRAIPLGGRAAPEFRDEHAPTLDEVLAAARGRIRLNIELKYYGDHQPGLAGRVIEAVRAAGMIDQVIVQCLDYEPLQEVRRIAPGLPVGYLFSVNARRPKRLEVDFLSTEMARVNPGLVADAHRRGQQVHVWTVDTPADMDRMIDLGVDNLITNEPAEAIARVRDYEALPEAERALRQARAWVIN
jgi:glycerophosphoryl diester phosphodiesterase